MKQYTTFAKMESLLLTAINLRDESVRSIAAATGIRADTLYKWKITEVHLSHPKQTCFFYTASTTNPSGLNWQKPFSPPRIILYNNIKLLPSSRLRRYL